MQAAQIFAYGPPEVLRISEVDRPEPGPGQVLVAVGASSVNGHDALVRAGAMKIVSGRRFPVGVGLDFAGTVAATGPGVEDRTVGEAVWGTVYPRGKHLLAGAAEYVVVAADRLGSVPPGLSAVEAAALVVPGVTAVTALRAATHLRAGESVLVRGAAGGVGTAVVQLAHASGGRVTALARARQAEALTGLGADEVVDYGTMSPGELGPFDVIVDTVGTELAAFRRRLTRGGRMVTVGLSGPAIAAIAASAVHGSRRIRTFGADPRTADLRELAGLVAAGAIRPLVAATFPLGEIAAAHAAFARGGVLGRQVVRTA
jgi:NADPH:quinone reductase-like Zn-dependent oxidoreductase